MVSTATGPRWLAFVGLDRALLAAGLLQGERPTLLVGASAGAWRSLALASGDPARAHQALVEAYVAKGFPRGARPTEVSAAYRSMLADLLPPGEVRGILGHPGLEVAVHTCRARGPLGSRHRWAQLSALVAAAAATAITPRALHLFLERVLFHSRPSALGHPMRPGRVVPLTAENLLAAALASGTVPMYLDPVVAPPGAPPGRYLDGGVGDYHLRQLYQPATEGVTLLFHHQSELRPTWFDRGRPSRRPDLRVVDPVFLVYPDPSFVAALPGGRPPDRSDFLELADHPQERRRRWNEAVSRSERLGEAFLEDLRRGRIADLLKPI